MWELELFGIEIKLDFNHFSYFYSLEFGFYIFWTNLKGRVAESFDI